MQNLDQIRAAKALDAASHTTREAVSKLPAMIMQNGLLAATAFATEKSNGKPKRKEMNNAMDAAAQHLKNPVHGLPTLAGCEDAGTLIHRLTRGHQDVKATPLDLQRATSEVLAFLSYLKRFATKEATSD